MTPTLTKFDGTPLDDAQRAAVLEDLPGYANAHYVCYDWDGAPISRLPERANQHFVIFRDRAYSLWPSIRIEGDDQEPRDPLRSDTWEYECVLVDGHAVLESTEFHAPGVLHVARRTRRGVPGEWMAIFCRARWLTANECAFQTPAQIAESIYGTIDEQVALLQS